MGLLEITPSKLCGTVELPPSKSGAHRAIICALLARGKSTISPIEPSDDIIATINAARALGAKCNYDNKILEIDSTNSFNLNNVTIDCNESGSTLRFMLAVVAALGINAEFTGKGRLPSRPITDFYDLFPKHGANLSNNGLPLMLSGKLKGGIYEIRGDISSQFITGLMLSLPLLDVDSEIIITTKLESKGYIDLTIDYMKQFGVEVIENCNRYLIKGLQRYKPQDFIVESDWSQAAFFMAAGAIGGNIKIKNLNAKSIQGDKMVFDIMQKFGADIYFDNDLLICNNNELHAIDIDASQIPDLVPALAITAAFAKGTTKITGASRLRIKESDRIKSVCDGLQKCGCKVKELSDGMEITGSPVNGAEIDCYGDHRIAMAFSILAAYTNSKSIINGFECVSKSYPDFYDVYKAIGGKCNVKYR